MKTLFTLGLVLTISFGSYAQPEITSINMPSFGDHVPVGICSGDASNVGDAGANVTWDFSDLNELEEQAFDFVNPDDTPFGYRYPDATICGIGWMNSYSYYNVGASNLSSIGHAIVIDLIEPTDTSFSDFEDPESIIDLPWNYQDSFSDSFEGENIALGFTIGFTGTADVEVDGHGTLILPNGTYNNVLRVHLSREQQHDGFTPDQTKEQYFWVSEDFKFWLLLMETLDDGFNTSHQIWYSKDPIPVSSGVEESFAQTMQIYPVPVREQQLTISLESPARQIFISDLEGRRLREISSLQSKTQSIEIKEAPGMYLLSVMTDQGLITKRIIIQ